MIDFSLLLLQEKTLPKNPNHHNSILPYLIYNKNEKANNWLDHGDVDLHADDVSSMRLGHKLRSFVKL